MKIMYHLCIYTNDCSECLWAKCAEVRVATLGWFFNSEIPRDSGSMAANRKAKMDIVSLVLPVPTEQGVRMRSLGSGFFGQVSGSRFPRVSISIIIII